MAKNQVQALLRVAWDTVGRIITRVVADRLDERRLQGLIEIGVDEISYRRGHRYLTNVADHRTGGIIWSAPGRTARTLEEFFELLGDGKNPIRAVSIDMSEPYPARSAAGCPTPRSRLTLSTSSRWPAPRSTRSAASRPTPWAPT